MELLKLESITKDYGNGKGLFNFSMNLNKGEIVGLIGINGAGKTTLLDTVSGKILADSGEIFYEGEKMGIDSNCRKEFGISVNPGFYDYLNTYENLKAVLYLNGISDKKIVNEKIKSVLKIVGLENVDNKKIKEFSFGMKQRLGFAQAILNSESIMLLDEPFVGLDVNGRNMVKEYVKDMVEKKQMAVVFSDHNLDEVKALCNRLVVIRNGRKIYDGNLDIKSSIIIKVKDSSGIDDSIVKKIDPTTVEVTEKNLNDKIKNITRITEITRIEKVINPLEKMLEVNNNVENH